MKQMAMKQVSRGFIALVIILASSGLGIVAAQAAEPVALAPGSATILRDSGRSFRSLSLALASTRDGDTVRLSAGRFVEAVTLTDKRIRIEGAGAGRTLLTAPGTVIEVGADARLRLVGLSVVSKGRPRFAPAILARGDGLFIEGCEVTGASGFAVEIQKARRDVRLEGNTLHGNRGGGVRLTDAVATLIANVIVDNPGPGILLEGEPPEGRVVNVEHDTIVRNTVQGVPVCAAIPGALDASVPDALRGRLVFSWNIASGALPEGLLSKTSLAGLQRDNLLVWPKKVGDVFVDVEAGDYRPSEALPVDPGGLELGALLSEAGLGRLRPAIDAALAEGRVGRALALARRSPKAVRGKRLDQVREALYTRFVHQMEAKQGGLALFDFFQALVDAPETWNVRDRFVQALSGVRAAYAEGVDWSGLFPKDRTLRPLVEADVLAAEFAPARPPASGPDGRRWIVRGELSKDLLVERSRRASSWRLATPNPDFPALRDTLAIARHRRLRANEDRQKAEKELEAYQARHPGGDSSYARAKSREIDRLSQRVVDLDRRIRSLEETFSQVKEAYEYEVRGELDRSRARAEATLELVDPVGARTPIRVPMDITDVYVAVAPVPALAFPGIAKRSVSEGAERSRYAKMIVQKALESARAAMESRDLTRISALLEVAFAGRSTSEDTNELVELVAVHADRLAGAVTAQREVLRLRALLETLPKADPVNLRLRYNREIHRTPPIVLDVETSTERTRVERRLAAIDRRFGAHIARLGDLRLWFERVDAPPLEDFLREVHACELRAPVR